MSYLYYFMIGVICIVNVIMSKKVNMDSEQKMSDTAVYKWYILGLIAFAAAPIVVIWTFGLNKPQPLFPFTMTLFFSFRAVMELIYIKETRRYIVSCAAAAASLIFTVLFLVLRIL
ncbi:hypothetical protein AWM70_14570 [Paenibacillus yonginensis]|uniref:DUF4181 domain-containing protein n=1 Tax=Paenibacillus yonginensis TaxID=1462996 RepID=A0A1B1N2L8_9BACL|nr:DUF4181 domain-containing protein [Paenibacillus yonginensis]ANS75670.1 hypothetical protein AWM70_14570 [Paenibacillus yonginensis]